MIIDSAFLLRAAVIPITRLKRILTTRAISILDQEDTMSRIMVAMLKSDVLANTPCIFRVSDLVYSKFEADRKFG